MAYPRSTIVMARVSPEEKRALLAAATRRGLTISELIRDAASRATGGRKWQQ